MWATLRAYGREGYREIVEHDLDLAQASPRASTRRPTSSVSLTCAEHRVLPVPAGRVEDGRELNELNRRIGEAAIEDGRVYFGTTDYGGAGVPPGDRELADARSRTR